MSENDDPVFEILCLKSSVHIPADLEGLFDKDDECFREFREFNRAEIEELFKNHQDITNNSEILQKLNFSFPFRPDLIPTVMSLTNEQDPNFRYRSRFILFTFIAWQNNPIMEHAPVVIHSLTEIINLPDYSKCALDAIERCFQISFVKSPLDDFEIIFPLFKGIFTKKDFISKIMTKQRLLYQYLRALQISSQEKGRKEFPEIKQYIEFLKKYSKDELALFNNDTISQIFNMSSNYLSQLDMTALEIFSTLSQLTNDAVMAQFVMLFAEPLKTMMESEPPFLVLREPDSTEVNLTNALQNRQIIKLPTFSLGIEGQFQYVPIETFKSGLDIQKALIIADKPHFKSYFKQENYKRISLILTAYQKHEMSASLLFDWFCETLKEMTQHPDSPYFFDFALMFISLYRSWLFPSFSKKFWDTIFNTELFDDRFNAVNDGAMPPLIDKIRMTVISVLAKDEGFESISHVFESITTRPALMAEMLHRTMSVFDKISTNNLNNVNLIRTISTLLIYFQNINFDKNYESIVSFVEASRSSLFLFISRILQIKDCCSIWMNNKVFCITFLKFVFEPPIRQFVLSNTLNYLITLDSPDDKNISIFGVIHDICSFTFDRIPQEQYVIISTEILQVINECLTHKANTSEEDKFKSKAFTKKFIDMVDPVFSAINMLNNENQHICGDFLVQAIHFFASLSSEINLSNSHMILIIESTKKVFDKEPSNAIFSKFVQLIAGTQLSSISPSFIIKQPIALFPLVEVFRESTNILNILQFIYKLIEYSLYNSIIANEYNFDSFLLSIIQSHKCDLKFDQKIIQSLFQIVSLICNTTSSSPVIQKFIDLLCPIYGKYLSIYQPLYIQKMQEIISSTMKAPPAFLPLNGKESTYIEFKNVTSSLLGKKFTFTFWISIDKIASESKLNIFSILDCKSRGIYVMVSTTSLLIKVIYKDLESTARCETPLPMGVWTPILIRVEFLSGKIVISPSVDRCICRKLEFNYDGFHDENLQVRIGYTPEQKLDEVSHVYLSSFQIYNKIYPNDEIPRFFDIGPRQTISDFKDALFTLQLSNNKGDIGIENGTLEKVGSSYDTSIKANLVGKSVRCHPSFCSVLISGDKADLFNPLFSFFDMPTIEGKYLLQVPDLTIDLIMATLSISVDVEKAFENKSGFQIILHLLLRTKIFKPTYSTYNRLFMLLPTLTYENLKISLIKYILVNFSLLAKYDRINQERIVKHWSRVLVYENQNLLAKVWSVKNLLCAIETFINYKRQQNENLMDIQANLFKLLTMIASIKLTKEDLEALICFSLQCSDDQSIYILRLFNEIIRSESKTIDVIKENMNTIYQLHRIIKKNNPEILFLLIDFIYELHNQNIITEINIQQHADILIQYIQSPIINDDVLFGLIERINQGKNELLPMACFIAMNMEDDYISTLFTDVEPHNLTFISRFWVIAVASIAPPDIRSRIIKFILECHKNSELTDIFYTVEIVSESLGDDHLPHELILILAQDLVHRLKTIDKKAKADDNDNDDSMDNDSGRNKRNTEIDLLNTQIDLLFQFASSTIFFQHIPLRILEEEFKHSPFAKFVDKSKQTASNDKGINDDSTSFSLPKARHYSTILNKNSGIVCGDSEDSEFSDCSCSETGSDPMTDYNSANKYKKKEKTLRSSLKSSSVVSQLHKMNVKKSNLAGTSLSSMLYLDSPYPAADASDSEINNFKPKRSKSGRKKITASVSLKRLSSDSDTILNLDNSKRMKYKPNWIFEEIRKFEKGKVFSIRTDKSGRWLDCDIAEWCMKLFDRRRGNLFLNFALLLIAFMLKYHPNILEIEHHLKKMQLKQSQIKANDSFLCLIRKNCKRFKRRIRDIPFLNLRKDDALYNDENLSDEKKLEEKKNDYKAFCCFTQFVNASKNQIIESNILKMQKSFIKSQDSTNQFIEKDNLLSNNDIENIFSDAMTKYVENERKSKQSFSELWTHSWRSLTFELAPWESAVVSTTRAIYERSLALNHSLIPVLMKRKTVNDSIRTAGNLNDKFFVSKDQYREFDCKLISPKQKTKAKLCINFESKKIQLNTNVKSKSFDADEIRFVVPINRKKKSSNIFEFILHNGKSYLIDLLSQKLNPLLKDILDISSKNENSKLFTSQFKPKLDIITEKWVENKISTFEYITKLNIFAGRTFNDINHYPMFPWVLKTYCSKVEFSDLYNKNIYRDFSEISANEIPSSLTAAAQAAAAAAAASPLSKFRSRAKSNVPTKSPYTPSHKIWNSEQHESDSMSDIDSSQSSDKSKHQSCNNSDSLNEYQPIENGAILIHNQMAPGHSIPPVPTPPLTARPAQPTPQSPPKQRRLLSLMTPITESEKQKIKQNSVRLPSFSQPAHDYDEYVSTLLCRVPYNARPTGPKFKFRSISDFYDENGYFHEIIPEFYSFPECLSETDGYPAVELPLWADSPIDFVYKHRKMLESDFISSKIHVWFDCIFGIQRPNDNRNTSSIVSSASYSNTYSEEEDENEDENSLWPLPKQLFTASHLQRKVSITEADSPPSDNDNNNNNNNSNAAAAAGGGDNKEGDGMNGNASNVPLKQSTVSMKISPSKDQKEARSLSTTSGSAAFISNSSSYQNVLSTRLNDSRLKTMTPIPFKLSMQGTKFVFALIDSVRLFSKSLLTFLMITTEGIIKQVEVDIADICKKANESTIINPKSTVPDGRIEKSRIPPKREIMNAIVPLNGGFAITNGQESLFLIYEKNATQKTIRAPFGNIRALCSSGDFFATIGTDMTTRIFKADQADQPIHSISTYQGETTCAAISKNFGIFVSGSVDGAIHICSLSNGNVQKVVDIENKPIHIIISEGWGFIVVFSKVMPSTSNASFFSSRPSSLLENPSNSNLSLDSNSSSIVNLNSNSSIDLLQNSRSSSNSNSNSNTNLKLSSQSLHKSVKRTGSASASYELLLYTVNGIFVNSVSISDEVVAWETWVDRKGFDYLAIALKGGKVHMFELYYMMLGHPILMNGLEIIGIKYDKHTNSLIIVSSTGEGSIIPAQV